MPILIPIVSLSLLACLSALFCWGLIRFAPKDAPDGARKQQSVAVPTSGGLAIALASCLGICLILWLDQGTETPRNHFAGVPFTQMLPYALLCLGALIIGGVDDAKPLPARPRLLGLGLATILAACVSPVFEIIFLPVADALLPLPGWVAIGGTALWIFVLMNASNFMDGSNGLALGTLAIMLGGLATRFLDIPSFGLALFVLCAVIISAIIGFLFWNLQGKLYAGDAGALFGGALFASLSVFSAQDGNIWLPVTLALPFLVDVFMTLLWRVKLGDNLLTPHRHHAYQLFIRAGWGHIKTAMLWWGLSVLCAGAALWAASQSKSTSACVFLAMLGLGCALWLFQRRFFGHRATG